MRTIANYVGVVRQASLLKKKKIRVPKTKFLMAITEILFEIGYINEFKVNKKNLCIWLSYKFNYAPLKNLVVISKSSKRVYVTYLLLKYDKSYLDKLFIVSTNQGLMTSKKAVSCGLGGELIMQLS